MLQSNFGNAVSSLFTIDPGTVYLDNASVGPLPLSVEMASREAVSTKARPWLRNREESRAKALALRTLAASLVGADANDMAITCAASYGIAVARRNLPFSPGQRILVLEDDHTSQTLTWREHARRSNGVLDVVPRPADGDWTSAILEHLKKVPPPAIAALCATFWRDGAKIDLPEVCDVLHSLGSKIVLDLTQSVGVLDLDVRRLRADFAVFTMYKWLLGPYSLAFLYVAPDWQAGEPLEENMFNRESGEAYIAGAVRFDMGEKDTFVSIATATESLRFLSAFDREAMRVHLFRLTDRLAVRVSAGGLRTPPAANRSPHIIGVSGVPAGAGGYCRRNGVYVTERDGEVRVAPHMFNTEADIDRCAEVLTRCAAEAR